jgi:hypothetical protein
MLILRNRGGVHPDDLMKAIADTSLTSKLAIAAGIHIIVILLTSVHMLGKQAQAEAGGPAGGQPTVSAPAAAGSSTAADAPGAADAAGGTEGGTPAEPAPASGDAAGADTPPVVEELNEVLDERPGESGVSFDDVDEL